MAYLTDKDEINSLYTTSKAEGKEWKRDYPEFERLADNELIDDLDESLPEVNDGSLAAALFKLPKRVVSSKLTGRPRAIDRDDAWLSELAKIQWENNIVKNANTQAPFTRKLKDGVRKAGIYGGIPLINLFVERGNYTGSDFIVASAYDVTLEAGKVSDYDSDLIFWDVYYSDLQLDNLIEQAEEENKESEKDKKDYQKNKDAAEKKGEKYEEDEPQPYNRWDVKALKAIKKAKQKTQRESDEEPDQTDDKALDRTGHHFYIAFQRGVEAPFYMCHTATEQVVREWTNPDPTGDIPVHYLYCYQDFVNPYGIGINKLAGGTQNVLDYMRQSDVLATQLGLRPPKLITGDTDEVDEDSLIYAEDANWWVGNARLERMELANGVYAQLPNRIAMYKTSLNQLIPTGDTSIASGAGDPQYSKTPAGVKFQAANLSIDDEDFKDNLYITYEAMAKSMINVHFANMQGVDLMKLSDEEREILTKAGLDFPEGEDGQPTNELEIEWDKARAEFDFEVEAEIDKDAEDKEKLDALLGVAQLRQVNPQQFDMDLLQSKKRLDAGELMSAIIGLTTDNDKILVDVEPEDQGDVDPETGQPIEDDAPPPEVQAEAEANIQAVMQQYGVDAQTAAAALEAEQQGYPIEEIVAQLQGASNGQRR